MDAQATKSNTKYGSNGSIMHKNSGNKYRCLPLGVTNSQNPEIIQKINLKVSYGSERPRVQGWCAYNAPYLIIIIQ